MSQKLATKRRCAIYTRKSSDEGLEQSFNSLDAQRDSGEAHIAAMRGEGWVCLPERYDDGGCSGGNMERPGLMRLMHDIESGRIDTVVVYKIDRLTRSLTDFARMMEVFDRHAVSFVAVTQQFNTTTSMGRLMLNVLLSFAQFEREIASERTRDKIAASRRKGKWTGGKPILGYDIERREGGNRLAVNEAEAVRVREIFWLYQRLGSLRETCAELARRGWATKAWTTRDGVARGGRPFDKSALYALLCNPAYIGKIRHHSDLFDAEHAGIVDPEHFEAVGLLLASHGRGGSTVVNNRHGALLKRLLYCGGCGVRMGHSFASKKCKGGRGDTSSGERRLYRYYVCQSAQSHGAGACPATKGGGSGSIPAEQIEALVVAKVKHVASQGRVVQSVAEVMETRWRERVAAARAECRRVELDLEAVGRQRSLLAGRGAAASAETLAALDSDAREFESERARLARTLEELEANPPDAALAEESLTRFDGVWMTLSPAEKALVLESVLERVEFDRLRGEVAFVYRPGMAVPDARTSAESTLAREAAA
jgi:site-specific DNA recombinase